MSTPGQASGGATDDPTAATAQSVFCSWTDPAQVRAHGAALRLRTPVSAHASTAVPADRPSPTRQFEITNTGRLDELTGLRRERMASSPFAFLRGSAGLMALDLAGTPRSGLRAQICGDAHAANIGFYGSPERRLVLDLNDFDETVPGPWEWDLKRMATSLVVAGREGGVAERRCREAAADTARAYRSALREIADRPVLDAWLETNDRRTLRQFDLAHLDEVYDRVEKKARRNTSSRAAARFTQRLRHDHWRFVPDPPVLVDVPAERTSAVIAGLERYATGLAPELQALLGRFAVADVAFRVVGTGSVGLRCYVVLLHGNGEDALILQVKQARRAALAAALPVPPARHEGERIVAGQRWMQTVSDPLLGWTTIGELPYQVRQFRDMKGGIDPAVLRPAALDDYARLCGAVLARAHARSLDARLLAGYCDGAADAGIAGNDGAGGDFDNAVAAFAVAYADQTEADHAAFVAGR